MALSEQLADLCKVNNISELKTRVSLLQDQLETYGYWVSLDGVKLEIRCMPNYQLISTLKVCTRMDAAYKWDADRQRQFAELIIEAHRRNLSIMDWLI